MGSCEKVPGALASSTACFSSLPSNVKYSFDVDDSDDENVNFSVREDNEPPKDCEFLDIDGGEGEEPFDYHLDHLEFKYNEEMKIFEFIISQVRLHYSDSSPFSIPSESKELPNDAEIKKKLEKHYGPLDFDSSDANRELFQNFKTEVISEYKKWIDSANKILKKSQTVKSKAKSKFNLESILAQINQEMCPIKPRYLIKREEDMKQSPNVLKSEMEPYDLPRPSPAQFIQETIAKLQKEIIEQETTTTTTEVQVQVDEDRITRENFPFNDLNLAFFDPIIDKFDRVKLTKGLKYPLVKTILQVLKRFPLGISPNCLFEEFEKEHHYQIDYKNLGFSSFEELLTKNGSVFSVFKSELTKFSLVFPAFLEVNPNIDEIQKKICHWLLVMLQILKKPVPVEKVTDTLNEMFDLKHNVKAYGLTEEMYYRKIVGFWASNRVELIKLVVPSSSESSDNCKRQYAIRLKELVSSPDDEEEESSSLGFNCRNERRKFLELQQQEIEMEFISKFQPKLQSVFVGFRIPMVADYLTPGLVYHVKSDLLIHPGSFNVMLLSDTHEREAFIRYMTQYYEDCSADPLEWAKMKIEDREFLQPGVFIAVKFEADWVRGKIVKKIHLLKSKETVYKIFFVDLGEVNNRTRINDIKYLHMNFSTFPTVSIQCRLGLRKLQDVFGRKLVYRGKWEAEQMEFFCSILTRHIFGLVPLKRVKCTRGKVWEVNVFLTDDQEPPNIIIPDLADSIIHHYWPNKYLPSSSVKKHDCSESSSSSDDFPEVD